MVLEVFVHLKTPDVVATTARTTLTHLLHYSQLKDLDRWEYWCIRAPPFLEEKIASALPTISEIVNLQKHRFVLRRDGQSLPLTEDPDALLVLVQERGDDASAQALHTLLTRRFGEGIDQVTRGTLWVLSIEAKNHAARVVAARRMVEATHQWEGLLVNPHAQTYTLYDARLSPLSP